MSAVAGQQNTYQVAFEGACNLPEYSQLPQFLPLNCQLIDPIKLTDHVNTSVGWLLNLDLAKVDHVFAIPILGFALSFLAVIAAVLQFVQVKMTSPRPNADDPTSSMTSTMTYTFPLLTIIWGGIFPVRPDPVLDRVHRLPGGPAIPDHGLGQPLPHLRLAALLGAVAGGGRRARAASEAHR